MIYDYYLCGEAAAAELGLEGLDLLAVLFDLLQVNLLFVRGHAVLHLLGEGTYVKRTYNISRIVSRIVCEYTPYNTPRTVYTVMNIMAYERRNEYTPYNISRIVCETCIQHIPILPVRRGRRR